MNDAPLPTDIASAASTATASPSFRLLPLCPGGEGDEEVEGEGEWLEVLSGSGVAVSNKGRPHLPSTPPSTAPASPLALSAPLPRVCFSQSASTRLFSEEAGLRLLV